MTAHSELQATIITVSPFRENCILLFDKKTKKGVLIDPGAELPHILDVVAEHQVQVEAIWLTHAHIDHAGAAKEAAETLGVEIYGPHKADKILIDNILEVAKQYQWPDKVQVFTPEHWLNDGETLYCAGHPFKVLHTPGHAPGHVIFYSEEAKLAIVGDVLFRGAVGRTDFPTCSTEDLMRSLKEKVLPLGDDVIFISGHGRGSTIGHEKKTNPFLQNI